MKNHSRVFSAMRPISRLHLGHYHGALKNWIKLQYEHDCFFMIADLHALTTNYANTKDIEKSIHNMVIDWLACGVDPSQSAIFIQSQVPQHAQMHLLLSMITPLSWLERELLDKEQHIDKLSFIDQDSYGVLGYPLLQCADILLYATRFVPITEDQVSRIELTREIARRFNHIYGRELGFEEKARVAMKKLGSKKAELYEGLLTAYQQEGDDEALDKARYLLADAVNLSLRERERLFAFLENKSKVILKEPLELISDSTLLAGLDGQKMSKSTNNTILLREDINSITKKIRSMPTDPARVRRLDSGNPEKCPVWQLHKVYADVTTKKWVQHGCVSASIGCLDCKGPLIENIYAEQLQFFERAKPFQNDYNLITNILADGAEKAAEIAEETLLEVKDAMNINY